MPLGRWLEIHFWRSRAVALNVQEIKCLIFDLDDTLFDTHGQLMKPATREACAAMIQAGLKTNLENCIQRREVLFSAQPRKNIYEALVDFFGVKENTKAALVAEAGFKAFHDREIKEKISAFEDAFKTLEALQKHFHLILVTLGTPKTQMKKVELLKFTSHFESIIYVNVASTKTKTTAFKEVMAKFPQLKPRAFVSIGNRSDSDIHNAKELGMQAILRRHGEYLHLKPQGEFEHADAEVNHLTELLPLLMPDLK